MQKKKMIMHQRRKKNIITLKGEKSEEDIVTRGMRTGYIVLH